MGTDVTDILTVVAGVALVAIALRDVFRTLFHPSDRGALCARLCSVIWFLARRSGRRARLLAGPTAVVVTIAVWVALLIVGYALIYSTQAPGSLSYGTGTRREGSFQDAVYLSFTAISTVGFGDVVVGPSPLRLLAPAQALTGFMVLTAAIAWLGQIYPALARRRALAVQVTAFWEVHGDGPVDESVLADVADTWVAQLSALTVDLVQNAETFYFRERDPGLSLGGLTLGIHRCVHELEESAGGRARLAATGLDRLLDRLMETMHDQYGLPRERDEALRALRPH